MLRAKGVRLVTAPVADNMSLESYFGAAHLAFEVVIGNDLASQLVDDMYDNLSLDAVEPLCDYTSFTCAKR